MSANRRPEPTLGDVELPEDDIRRPRRPTSNPNEGYDWISLGCFLVGGLLLLFGIVIVAFGASFAFAFGTGQFALLWGILLASGTFTTALVFIWMGHVHNNLRLLVQLAKRR